MKIYIVMMDDWHSTLSQIYAVYSSKEKAAKVVEECNKNMDNIEYYVIEEWME